MKKTYILGNGGYAQEVFEQIFLRNVINNFGGFIILKDNKAFLIGDEGVAPFTYPKESAFILGTGNKAWRQLFIEHFLKYYPKTITHWPNAIATNAYISLSSQMGIGNVFNCFASVNANSVIGNFNIFNVYSSSTHDNSIGNNNIISPYCGIMGFAKIGDDNFLGANVTITPKVLIGNDNTISAGECVFDNMNDREFFQSGIIRKKP
jgi:acetyltransferase-like isoleucine patch superfamily enzyme